MVYNPRTPAMRRRRRLRLTLGSRSMTDVGAGSAATAAEPLAAFLAAGAGPAGFGEPFDATAP